MEEIAKKYGLDLNGKWNKDLLPHQGRHPNEYHEYVLNSMKQFDEVAQGNVDIFLLLYDYIKCKITPTSADGKNKNRTYRFFLHMFYFYIFLFFKLP